MIRQYTTTCTVFLEKGLRNGIVCTQLAQPTHGLTLPNPVHYVEHASRGQCERHQRIHRTLKTRTSRRPYLRCHTGPQTTSHTTLHTQINNPCQESKQIVQFKKRRRWHRPRSRILATSIRPYKDSTHLIFNRTINQLFCGLARARWERRSEREQKMLR
jgi:hypothetical protein